MWDWLQGVLGNVTGGELALVGILFVAVMGFSWAPRIGEAIGRWWDDEDLP